MELSKRDLTPYSETANNVFEVYTVYTSESAINTAIPLDILYNIFILAVYDSSRPMGTVLTISHVCRHWRRSAMGWPALWGFIDLRTSCQIVDLFLSQSENASLTLSLPSVPFGIPVFDTWRLYLESKANNILPRLCSLTSHFMGYELPGVRNLFRNLTKLQPLRLRHLDIVVSESPENRPRIASAGHYSLRVSCPLLCELKFSISECDHDSTIITTAITASSIKLYLPNLKRLILDSEGIASYNYIREFSSHIRTLTSLSEFHLDYDDCPPSDHHPPFNIFEAVPDGALSCCIGHHYLFLNLTMQEDGRFCFRILSAPGRRAGSNYPLDIFGSLCPLVQASFDYLTPILSLIHRMPEITHIATGPHLWEVVFSWVFNIPNLFPCLKTLELNFMGNHVPGEINLALGLLPAILTLKGLVLKDVGLVSYSTLLGVVLRTGVEYLEINGNCYFDEGLHAESLKILFRQRGVVVAYDQDDAESEPDSDY